MPIIMTPEEGKINKAKAVTIAKERDVIDGVKFNALPSPIIAKIAGGSEWWIETLDVSTGLMRLDVCGQIDLIHFSEVVELIDFDGEKHDPDDFWND